MGGEGQRGGRDNSDDGAARDDAPTKLQIDRDIAEIKKLLTTGKYKQIRFSIDKESGLIGTGNFQVADSVKRYITREIKKLGTYRIQIAPDTIAGLRATDETTRATAAADLAAAVVPRQTRAQARAAAFEAAPVAARTRARRAAAV